MRAMLVCAGFGTRLSPLTDLLPKPAVPVANKPLAWFALDHLQRAGVRDFIVNTHHLAQPLMNALSEHAPSGVALKFVHEPEILGTGGGVKAAWSATRDEPLLTMNGKLLFAPDVQALLSAHAQSGAIATMVLKPLADTDTFSAVEIDDEGRVWRILGQPTTATAPALPPLRRMMFTGVQVLHPRAHRDLPDAGCIIRQTYLPWLGRGERVMSVVDPHPFQDAGVSLTHYFEANVALLSGERTWPGIRPHDGQNLIDPTAQVPSQLDAHLSVVGAHARVAEGVTLDRCVIWPDTQLQQSVSRAIVTPAGIIQL